RIVPRQREIAAVIPQRRMRERLPHVAQLTEPRAGIAPGAGPVTPVGPDPFCGLLRYDLRHPGGHRLVAGGIDNHVGSSARALTKRGFSRVLEMRLEGLVSCPTQGWPNAP